MEIYFNLSLIRFLFKHCRCKDKIPEFCFHFINSLQLFLYIGYYMGGWDGSIFGETKVAVFLVSLNCTEIAHVLFSFSL